MFDVVVDTNILFSALFSKKSNIRNIIISKKFNYFSCNFSIVELLSIKTKLLENKNITQKEWQWYAYEILKNIKFINEHFISKKALKKAKNLCNDIDLKDTFIVALSIDLDAYLWTGDKKLISGLKRKGYYKVITTDEIIRK